MTAAAATSPLPPANDWLGLSPSFVDLGARRWAARPDDLRASEAPGWDEGSLTDYLDVGYCVFGHTPLAGVRYLGPLESVEAGEGGWRIVCTSDPAEAALASPLPEPELVEQLVESVRAWERQQTAPILLPLSGGLDSRLLLACLRHPERAQAATYGTAPWQASSAEVQRARALCHRTGTHWQRVPLGDFHDFLPDWRRLMGLSCHAHGMYQMEFYTRLAAHSAPGPLLSGIVGDAWAGSLAFTRPETPEQFLELTLHRGSRAGSAVLRAPAASEPRNSAFEGLRTRLADPRQRVLAAIRNKAMLLRYLFEVPRRLGYRPWSPFLDPQLAMGMLSLPAERRRDRCWQRELIERLGLRLPLAGLRGNRRNTLDLQGLVRRPLPPLDPSRLGDRLRPDLLAPMQHQLNRYRTTPALLRPLQEATAGRAYASYMTLWPLLTGATGTSAQ